MTARPVLPAAPVIRIIIFVLKQFREVVPKIGGTGKACTPYFRALTTSTAQYLNMLNDHD
jgi:hypothetical protein